MKNIYAFENKEDYQKYEPIIQRMSLNLKEYQHHLEERYNLNILPRRIVWTSHELAVNTFSSIPIPAFTNKDLIYISPELHHWRKLFQQQLDGRDLPSIQNFYESFGENHLLVILAHELTHHSDLFLDEFDNERRDSIWFEEGMCFYLPRRILLSEKEFNEITLVETTLVETFKDHYGNHSLDEFGKCAYEGTLTSIMFDYWRSYLAVKNLVDKQKDKNPLALFSDYRNWHEDGRKIPLTEYFHVNK
ncbi:hypothetical protein [Falsibacillus pallidus]|uniref:Uncharacterized protein n=1 Tax=Falsibacillus pallidus TaxID=493781 RepID=A0A370GQP1_9BACI|nr:hypothetical protein [Falsibacillus pallidus]RDI45630.1 hypothetical protein DFR59_102261 [Falsibacillus pallidus]